MLYNFKIVTYNFSDVINDLFIFFKLIDVYRIIDNLVAVSSILSI